MSSKTEILVDLSYIEKGMVTPAQDDSWEMGASLDGNHIRSALESLDAVAARRAKRKFRKLHRKVRKQEEREVKELLSRSYWEGGSIRPPRREVREVHVDSALRKIRGRFGGRGKDPEIGQARTRRRRVYDLMQRSTWEHLLDVD